MGGSWFSTSSVNTSVQALAGPLGDSRLELDAEHHPARVKLLELGPKLPLTAAHFQDAPGARRHGAEQKLVTTRVIALGFFAAGYGADLAMNADTGRNVVRRSFLTSDRVTWPMTESHGHTVAMLLAHRKALGSIRLGRTRRVTLPHGHIPTHFSRPRLPLS